MIAKQRKQLGTLTLEAMRMALLGHGIDVIDLQQVALWIARDDEFIDGWFTKTEAEELRIRGIRPELVGGRVAAKEATAKALGTGFAGDVSWQDVEIHSDERGRPVIALSGGAERSAQALGVTRFLASISHTSTIAVASVIAIGDEEN